MKIDDLFTRLAETHRPDCNLLINTFSAVRFIDQEVQIEKIKAEKTIYYLLQCKPIYHNLKRIIGQLSGLAILAQLTKKIDVADLPELASCKETWNELSEQLKLMKEPSSYTLHKKQLETSHVFLGQAMRTFSGLKRYQSNDRVFSKLAGKIKHAYEHSSLASSQKTGLQMIDFSHACCSCGT